MADVSVTYQFVAQTTIVSSQVNTNFSDLVTYINNRNNAAAAWTALDVTGNGTIGGTLSVTGATTLTAGIIGTSTNDNPAVGRVGQLINGQTARSSPITTIANTAKTVISISLTAGDWDVRGAVGFRTQASTTNFYAGINTTTNALPTGDFYANFTGGQGLVPLEDQNVSSAQDVVLALPTSRVSLAGTTTLYLVQQSDAANNVYGYIEGRRIR